MSRSEGVTVVATMKRKGSYALEIGENRKAVLTSNILINQYYAEAFVYNPQAMQVAWRYGFEYVLNHTSLNAEVMVKGMMSFEISSFDNNSIFNARI